MAIINYLPLNGKMLRWKILQTMSIGFDLDKVFIDHTPLIPHHFVDKFHKHKVENRLSYRIPSKPEQLLRLITHLKMLRPIIEKNLDFVRYLKLKTKNKQYLISGRFGYLKKITSKITEQYHFDSIFDDMFFNFKNDQPHLFKDKIIRKMHLDKYIDDDKDLLEFLANRNPNTMFYWLNNQRREKMFNNLYAIIDLNDIL